ncbi:transporter, major facilitator family protein [Besnoitia besnoiti]|uniref:Transporter, major facilitator family protein n=1 Tax=Besnoitia besnoiti TaxID=94643 RepID=A0A2A9MQU4_BESBE|nr:transporter, major facilitator family protein [Besnoitia besnoiti]PFH38482.1 transporter, major facilitator family protein [Besnoitia besnoiti]
MGTPQSPSFPRQQRSAAARGSAPPLAASARSAPVLPLFPSSAAAKGSGAGKRDLRGYFSVLGGVFVHLCLGTVYTWGTLAVYVISYMRFLQMQRAGVLPPTSLLHDGQAGAAPEASAATPDPSIVASESLVRLSDAAWILASQFAGMTVAMPLGGKLQRTLGPCRTVIFGGALMSAAVGVAPFLLHSYYLFVSVFGVVQGLGLGLAYTAPLICGLTWFPHKKGIVSGVISAGFGTGALLFSPLQAAFLNPLNIPPSQAPYPSHPAELYYDGKDPEQLAILLRVPPLLKRLSFCYLLLLAAGAALLHLPARELPGGFPSSAGAAAAAREPDGIAQDMVRDIEEGKMSMSVPEALCSGSFWSLWLLFFLNGLAICFTATFWRLLAVDRKTRMYILSETQLALVGAGASACNALGRLAWGHVADRKGFQTSLLCLSALWSGLLFFLPNAAPRGGLFYALAVCGSFFCLGGNFSVFPSAVASIFGRDAVGHLYGFVFASQLASSLGFAYLTQRVAQSLGTDGLCTLMGLFTALTSLSIFCLPAVSPSGERPGGSRRPFHSQQKTA